MGCCFIRSPMSPSFLLLFYYYFPCLSYKRMRSVAYLFDLDSGFCFFVVCFDLLKEHLAT